MILFSKQLDPSCDGPRPPMQAAAYIPLLMRSAVLCPYRQLYAQEAACRLQAAERDGKSLQRLSKEEYLKMMLPDSPPGEDRTRKVRSLWPFDLLLSELHDN